MRNIRKSFGPVEVLHGVDFEVLPGEVHVLAGENGAGKSTLIKILSGVYEEFDGELELHGKRKHFGFPKEAVQAGIATIHQELSLVSSMSVADNLFLGNELTGRFGGVDFPAQNAKATGLLAEMGLEFSPFQSVAELPISGQQLLEITRALAREASVLILDEPTSALNEQEAEFLFDRIDELRDKGRGIVYITHRMDEIYRLADRISVLRDGELVGTARPSDLSRAELVKWMVDRDVTLEGEARSTPSDEPVLEVKDLCVRHPERHERLVVDRVSFVLQRGETLGLAGLQGSGTSEVLHGLFGALGSRTSGEVRFLGESLSLRGPRESIERGLVLLTNDRKSSGVAPELSVTHNASLAGLSRFSSRLGWIDETKERSAVLELADEFRLRAPSLDAPVRTLSGGNQQKVYLARCLLTQPQVLLLDEPTRGIDVGAKADVYELVQEWVGRGIAVLLITSEMDELLALCHRILVMFRGRVAAEFTRGTASKDGVMAAAMGHSE